VHTDEVRTDTAGWCTIREARPDDAERLLTHLHELVEEPDVLVPLTAGEPPLSYTVDQERRVLAHYAAADNAVFLVAEADGVIVGWLDCVGGTRSRNRHAVVLGISVRRAWRNRGVGSALLRAAIDWARGTGVITRIELAVYRENVRAIRLYEKFGFEREGLRRRAVRHRGQYVDDLVMALLL